MALLTAVNGANLRKVAIFMEIYACIWGPVGLKHKKKEKKKRPSLHF